MIQSYQINQDNTNRTEGSETKLSFVLRVCRRKNSSIWIKTKKKKEEDNRIWESVNRNMRTCTQNNETPKATASISNSFGGYLKRVQN